MVSAQVVESAREGKAEALIEIAKQATAGNRGYNRSREDRKHAVVDGLEVAKEKGDKKAEAFAHYALASFRLMQGEAIKNCQKNVMEAAKRLKEVGESQLAGRVLLLLAQCCVSAGFGPAKLDEALRFSKDAFALLGDASEQASARMTQAKAQLGNGRRQEAIDAANEALPLLKKAQDAAGEAAALVFIASVHLQNKEFIKAEASATSAVEKAPQGAKAAAQAAVVEAMVGAGKNDDAKKLATQALGGNDKMAEASLLHSLAKISLSSDAEEAIEKAERAMSLYLLMSDPRHEAAAAHTAAQGHLAMKSYDSALQLSMQTVAIVNKLGDQALEARALLTASHARLGKERPVDALPAAKQAYDLFRAGGDQEGEKLAGKMLKKIEEKMPPAYRPQNDLVYQKPGLKTNAMKKARSCLIWNNAAGNEGAWIHYGLEFLRFIDDMSKQSTNSVIVCCSQGVYGRQLGVAVAGQQKDMYTGGIQAMVRTVRLEMPRVDIRMCDFPTDADCEEMARIVCDATDDAGSRFEVAYSKVHDGKELLSQYGD